MVKPYRFSWDGSGTVKALCANCTKRVTAIKCKAYRRIPDTILKGGDCKFFNAK